MLEHREIELGGNHTSEEENVPQNQDQIVEQTLKTIHPVPEMKIMPMQQDDDIYRLDFSVGGHSGVNVSSKSGILII